jgi:hypothetical protein
LSGAKSGVDYFGDELTSTSVSPDVAALHPGYCVVLRPRRHEFATWSNNADKSLEADYHLGDDEGSFRLERPPD